MSCISVAPTSPLRAGAWEGCTRATEKRIGPSQPRIFSIHSHSCRMSHALHPGACQVHLQCRRDAPAGRERRKTAAALGGASPWARGKNHTRPSGQQRGGRLGLGRLEYGGRRAERGLCVQCRAVAAPSSAPPFGALSLSLPFGEINLDFIASALGYAMGAGSLLLFAPILINILKAKSSKGMSVTTWVLQLTAFAGSTLYNLSKGHPFSTFAEVKTPAVCLDAVVPAGVNAHSLPDSQAPADALCTPAERVPRRAIAHHSAAGAFARQGGLSRHGFS